MVLSSIARGNLVEIIRKRAGDNNPFTSEAMIILAERYNSPRQLLEGCVEVCIYCADEGLGEVTEAVVEGYITRQTRQAEKRQKRQTRQPEERQKEGETVDDGAIQGLQGESVAEEDMTGKRQKRQTIQTRQDMRLSSEQQKIAELLGRGVNTVKDVAKELDMGEAATRTQIKRMIEKGCIEVVSSERPKKYGLKE
jgi:DNA-binding NarL/FixJ family response regulator